VAWISSGEPGFSGHEEWDAAHLALAGRLDAMADGPVHTGSNMDDDIARAFLRREAAEIRAVVARAALGGTVRNWQGHLQDGRRVSSLARLLGVERKFLYRVFDGSEWRRR
jgi:hypothetical protein